MFEEQPQIKYGESLDIWKKNGSVVIKDWLTAGNIQVDLELKTVMDLEMYDKGVYTGQVNESGQKHGLGRWTWNGGQVFYEGMFHQDKYHGYGRFIDVYSFCYVGQFEHGLRQGYGKGTDNLGLTKEG